MPAYSHSIIDGRKRWKIAADSAALIDIDNRRLPL
jgi:hypothetical protein